MKTYYEKHSLEYNAKIRCFFVLCNSLHEFFCNSYAKLILIKLFRVSKHIFKVCLLSLNKYSL